jgi:hypothetical protein
MKPQALLLTLAAATLLLSCEPKPLDINIKQADPLLTVSSAATEGNTLLISAAYSASSLQSLIDTTTDKIVIPKELLLEDGILTLTAAGKPTDTIHNISPGVYARRDLRLEHGSSYTLNVYDKKKVLVSTATTTYYTQPAMEAIRPEVRTAGEDTSVFLHLTLNNVTAEDYYFVSYNTSSTMRNKANFNRDEIIASLASFTSRQLVLLSGADMRNGKIVKSIQLQAKANDTLLVHISKIDRAYYNYLGAYIKAGAFINQLTGEPINLPTNVVKGLGFFSMSVPVRELYYLSNY